MAGMSRDVIAKTGDFTVLPENESALFTNRGAGGAVNFTLPAVSAVPAGWWCEFFVVADQNVTITASPADTLAVYNDATADTFAISTASNRIGSGCRVIADGTGWLLVPQMAASDAATPLVARGVITT